MKIGMVGLGRMGGNMVRRLMAAGHQCVVYDLRAEAVAELVREGACGAHSLREMVVALERPRTVWLMLSAALVDETIDKLLDILEPGDRIVDGGNSHYHDDIRRAEKLAARGLGYLDVGVSGGVWGLERGYCLMVGGEKADAAALEPVFRALAPGRGVIAATPGRVPGSGTAEEGFLHCGPAGAGHFVKMVHNGIEYGLMAAYAEGMNILAHAGMGGVGREKDAETAPLRNPEHFPYQIDLPEVAELWRRGSVVGSWLLDLTAAALAGDPGLDSFAGRVSDSGEGRWTVQAAVEQGVPAPVITAALYSRFSSQAGDDLANRLLSAMRRQFGGHQEK